VKILMLSPVVSQTVASLLAHRNRDDLIVLRELLEAVSFLSAAAGAGGPQVLRSALTVLSVTEIRRAMPALEAPTVTSASTLRSRDDTTSNGSRR